MNAASRRKSVSSAPAKDATRLKIEQMEAEREERRKAIQQRKLARKEQEQRNLQAGNPGDVDFIGLVSKWRHEHAQDASPHLSQNPKICICVRKRPISDKERAKFDHDSVTCLHPHVWIHSAKFKVDGITKYLVHAPFQIDHAFDEQESTPTIYLHTTLPLLDYCLLGVGGRATVFCYGQTGSGKTHTMNGIQQILCQDLYAQMQQQTNTSTNASNTTQVVNASNTEVTLAFFELYGGFIQDLLHDRQRCKLLEDAQGEVNITGLQEFPANDPETFCKLVQEGNNLRTTHTTEANDTSSRSHAICQIFFRDVHTGKLKGKLSLVDLAGSERGTDTKSHNTQRRAESADINTSLLSLKECIRALGQQNNQRGSSNSNKQHAPQQTTHVPYRGSKLTLILKDCFTSPHAKTTMIATVSPGASAADHSLNTLRYADRIKEQRASKSNDNSKAQQANSVPPPSKQRLARIMGTDAPPPSPSMEYQRQPEPNPNTHTLGITDSDSWDIESEENNDDDDDALFTESESELSHNYKRHSQSVHRAISQESSNMNDSFDTTASQEEQDIMIMDDVSTTRSQVSATASTITTSTTGGPTAEDQAELRRTVQALFELEESLLNQHMSNIQENAEMLTEEGKLLQMVQAGKGNATTNTCTEEEMDVYAVTLAEYLDRKEYLIQKLQGKLVEFKLQLQKEQELAQRVTQLSQY